jgi:hypothetical protein
MTNLMKGLALLGVCLPLFACNFDNTRVHGCALRSYAAGGQYLLDYEVIVPRNCPVPIGARGETKAAGAHLYDYGYKDFAFGGIVMQSSDGRVLQERVVPFYDEMYLRSDGNSAVRYHAIPHVFYPAATGSRPLSQEFDLAYFVATNSWHPRGASGEPFGDVLIDYEQTMMASRIVGTSIPAKHTNVTWGAQASGGYPPYTYDWYRDGQRVGSGAYYSETVSRDFLLQLQTTDATMSVRKEVMAVDVDGVLSTLGGPTQIWVSQGGGTWTASANGGTAPYTFTWFINSRMVGQGETFTGYNPGQEGYFDLRVDVADAAGASTSSAMSVFQIGTGTGACDPEPGTDHC